MVINLSGPRKLAGTFEVTGMLLGFPGTSCSHLALLPEAPTRAPRATLRSVRRFGFRSVGVGRRWEALRLGGHAERATLGVASALRFGVGRNAAPVGVASALRLR